jgi:hypothetical protein
VFLEFRVATSDVADECLKEPASGAAGSTLSRTVDGIVFAFRITSGSVDDPGRVALWLFDPSQRLSDSVPALDRIVDVAAVPVRFVP